MTILDYVKKYNYTFEEKEFNEVDNLVLATIIYADMNKLIGHNEKITLGELSDRFFNELSPSNKLLILIILDISNFDRKIFQG